MKRKLSLLLVICIICSIITVPAAADEIHSGFVLA